ncbi:MAG: prepilin-type N-terminal cleavage/methylation domain-containing protein [Elusimicrobia bacterium]|nr:prepilin-type N-terminal cleavage/methylation domain-containing protein [Elusimicrobiota bacterium]
MKNSRGFSIIELVIAISLASFVLVGVATIAAQMARSQVEGIRSGTVTGWSLVSYQAMAKEIEDANVLAAPDTHGEASDSIVICKNWSRGMAGGPPGGPLDATGVSTVVQYCVDPAAPVPPETTGFTLRRFSYDGNCPCPGAPGPCNAVPVACTATPPGPWTQPQVVGFRLEKIPGAYNGAPNVFLRDDTIGGVRLRYVIGRQTATANEPVVKFTTFDFGISMQKQYTSTID